MATHAQIAARLLRDAATFFRNVAMQNEPLRDQLNDNAAVYDQVADLVESNPEGIVALEGEALRVAGKEDA
ncbi:MAG TPA: hypothetical protein VFX71_00920, partial [Hyphomicrobium sp.]|jgi:hypothetical protein|nr:hypothetical protein [Hyphomicrobium sp.]